MINETTVTDHLSHDTNILAVTFPRSGFNLLIKILTKYFNIPLCGKTSSATMFCSTRFYKNKKIACHRAHDLNLILDASPFNKVVVMYRKDIVEQLDAFFRYQFRNCIEHEKLIPDIAQRQTLCEELDIPYSDKKPFFTRVLEEYVKWIKKWVNTPTPNSIVIEYSDLMINPQKNLDKLQEHLLGTIDSDLSAKIVKEMNIEYKHSLSPKKYKELANLLLSLN